MFGCIRSSTDVTIFVIDVCLGWVSVYINVGIILAGKRVVYTISPVRAGEELTVDYTGGELELQPVQVR